jgi:CO/xanthine dehydrogenase Mo-binding subunit
MSPVSRRQFLTAGAAAGGGLLLGWHLDARPRVLAATAKGTPPAFAPNAFVRIGRDGRVTLIVAQVEMGQGTYTSMPMLLAEELEVGLDQVHVEHAPPDDKLYGLPGFGFQMTGASTSVKLLYEPLRRAGAAARSMLVAAAAQTWNVDAASCQAQKGVVTHAPTGRKLAYGELADRAAKLPVPTQIALKDPKDFALIGRPAKRLDTPAKVNGTAQFGIDVRLHGMKVATVAASPVLGGKVVSVDDSKAKAIKGVRQIVRLDDVVAVVADHMWAAKQGLKALAIRWDDGPNGTVSTADVVQGLAAAAQTPGVVVRNEGDAAAAVAGAPKKLESVYEVPFLVHAAMEPMNCTVHVRPDGCEVWTGSQVLSRAQATAAKVTGLPLEKVVVHNHLLGGGFGRRLEFDYVTQAVRIAKHVHGPVKVIWTREEDVQHDVYRPYYYDRLAAGVDARGQPIAWTHRIVGPAIVARWAPPAFKDGIDPDAVDGAEQLLYDIPAIRVDYVRHEEPVLNTGFWRGVGVTHNTFVIESFIDELAAAAKQDPVTYRRALLGKSPRAMAVLDVAAQAAGWGRPLPAGRGRGVSLLYSGWGSYLAQVAEVAVSKSGEVRVHRIVCAVDCGTVVNPDTVKAQIEGGIIFGIGGALYGEATLKNGRVEQSNFNNVRVVRINEAPAIEVHLVRNGEAPGGIGEPGTAVTAPALANAVFAATGKRIRKLPLERQLRSV